MGYAIGFYGKKFPIYNLKDAYKFIDHCISYYGNDDKTNERVLRKIKKLKKGFIGPLERLVLWGYTQKN